jgi:hypothetical protein
MELLAQFSTYAPYTQSDPVGENYTGLLVVIAVLLLIGLFKFRG